MNPSDFQVPVTCDACGHTTNVVIPPVHPGELDPRLADAYRRQGASIADEALRAEWAKVLDELIEQTRRMGYPGVYRVPIQVSAMFMFGSDCPTKLDVPRCVEFTIEHLTAVKNLLNI